jgi:hypothetical protein
MNKIIILLTLILLILFSGCINSSVAGKYVSETGSGAYFQLNKDLTFYEMFGNGLTASGEYSIDRTGNLTLVYRPFGSFRAMEKTKNGYRNKSGTIYEKV